MLALLVSVGSELYAIAARAVVEVVPRVAVRPVPRAPEWLCGVFAYRGEVLPVVDLCQRMRGSACPLRVSSRIAVVQHRSGRGTHRCGVLAERVTEVRQLSAPLPSTRLREVSLVSGTVLHGNQLIHILDLDAVLPGEVPAAREALAAAQPAGSER